MTTTNNSRTGLYLALILLALSAASNVFFLTQYTSKEDQLAAENALLQQKDSLQMELQRMDDSLSTVLAQLEAQGADAASQSELVAARAELARLRKQVTETPVQGVGAASKSKLADLQEAQDQIAELNQRVSALMRDNDRLMAANDDLTERNQMMGAEYDDLESRVNKGKRVYFGSLMTHGLTSEGTKTTKVNQIRNLSVSCEALENVLVTAPIFEEVTIRIIDPNGGVLSTTNTSLQNKSDVYSLKESIMFDGSKQKVSFKFPLKGELDRKLKKGQYTTELWTGGLLRQKNTFELF
ncbi:MAG: hypothetical protein RL577_829 [Bacteroidota bacterium]